MNVEISESTFGRVQRWATPLVDNFDTALRKVLDAAELQGDTAPEELLESSLPMRPVKAGARRERTGVVLVRNRLMKGGEGLHLMPQFVRNYQNFSERDPRLYCEVGQFPSAQQNFVWRKDGQSYSLSALTEKLRDSEGFDISRGALNGYAFWEFEDAPGRSLSDTARDLTG